jgi:hypothetical protein
MKSIVGESMKGNVEPRLFKSREGALREFYTCLNRPGRESAEMEAFLERVRATGDAELIGLIEFHHSRLPPFVRAISGERREPIGEPVERGSATPAENVRTPWIAWAIASALLLFGTVFGWVMHPTTPVQEESRELASVRVDSPASAGRHFIERYSNLVRHFESVVPYRVKPVPGGEFNPIQQAIESSRKDREAGKPTVIVVEPGQYRGGIQLEPGIHVRGLFGEDDGKVVVLGTVTVDDSGSSTVEDPLVSWGGITVRAMGGPCFDFRGDKPQRLLIFNSTAQQTGSFAPCLVMSNTGSDKLRRSYVEAHGCRFWNSGGREPALKIEHGDLFGYDDTSITSREVDSPFEPFPLDCAGSDEIAVTVGIPPTAPVALAAAALASVDPLGVVSAHAAATTPTGSGHDAGLYLSGGEIRGVLRVRGASIVELQQTAILGAGRPLMDIDAPAELRMLGALLYPSPSFTGTGRVTFTSELITARTR